MNSILNSLTNKQQKEVIGSLQSWLASYQAGAEEELLEELTRELLAIRTESWNEQSCSD